MKYMMDRKDAEIRRLRDELTRLELDAERRRAERVIFELWLVCGGIVLGAVVSGWIRLF